MGSIIEDLWLGELCPGEIPPKKTKETEEIIQNINRNKEILRKMLNDEQSSVLKELLLDLDYLYLLRRSEEFEKGFSVASKLLAEAFAANK